MPAAARVWSPRAVAWKEGSPSGVRRAALSGPTPSRLTPTATRRALSSRQSAGVSSVPLVWMAAWNLRPEARPKSSTFTAVSQRSRGSPPVNWMRRAPPGGQARATASAARSGERSSPAGPLPA